MASTTQESPPLASSFSGIEMEMAAGREQRPLVRELTRGRELVRQLEADLDQPSGVDSCKSLASEILATVEKAISMARLSQLEGSKQPFEDRRPGDMSQKRKTLNRRTRQVKVATGEGNDGGSLDDGYSWRKYGQKKILGAIYPRCYYRCTHGKSRGCPAIKQVQRSDDNPSVFNLAYRNSHTCYPRPQLVSPHPETGLGTAETNKVFMGSFLPSFISPATSESNYLSSASPWLQTAEYDFTTEIISAANSATNTTTFMDMDFMEFDFLPFDTSPSFSFRL